MRSAAGVRPKRRVAAALGAAGIMIVAIGAAAAAGYLAHPPGARLATVGVLKAAQDIVPGTVITADELVLTQLATPDTTALSNLVLQKDEAEIVGHVAAVGVRAGYLVPANVAAVDPGSALWTVNLPIRRMPSTLRAGDHAALMVVRASDGVDVIALQYVVVVAVQSGAADLQLQPKDVAQMQWYADHGGIVLLKMEPGAIQQKPAAGGGS